MATYPPLQGEVLEPFLKFLSAQRETSYTVDEQPDVSERQKPEVDYVLRDSRSGSEIAVEVSSVWRSSAAGMEDRNWSQFTERVTGLLDGKLQGTFHVYTELRIPSALQVQPFANELTALITQEDEKLTRLSSSSRGIESSICGMWVFVAKSGRDGSGVSFARKGERSDFEDDSPSFVRRTLARKSPKLKKHKDLGRETWLLLYHTFWTVMAPSVRQQAIRAELSPDHAHIDHIAIIAGNPPEDAWVEVVQ
jgi:hypothetical protein